jgi:lipid A 3-O-deacylase
MRLMNSRGAWIAALSTCTLFGALRASAADSEEAFTFALENDVFTGSDNNYSNGFGISWVSAPLDTYADDSLLNRWGRLWSFLPFVGDEGYETYASWTFGQEIDTPNDITIPNPSEYDQPYAGILYVDSLLYARKGRWTHAWELKLGVVGPASQADDTQTQLHELIGSDEPMGWHTQLPNEPVINVGYTVAYLAAAGHFGDSATQWRVVPVGTLSVGNYFTGAGAGVYGEFGWNLVDALGGTALRTGLNAASTVGVGRVPGWSVSFFGGVGGYGVAHFLPLDGTVFRDSRSVETETAIGMGSLGLCVRHEGLVVSLATTYFTDTFKTQQQATEFGTLSVSWNF